MENLPVPGPRKRTPGGGPWWYARGDLNPYPCGMEPKSIVSANSTTGAYAGRPPGDRLRRRPGFSSLYHTPPRKARGGCRPAGDGQSRAGRRRVI